MFRIHPRMSQCIDMVVSSSFSIHPDEISERTSEVTTGKRAKTVRDFVTESEGLGTLTEKLEAAEAALTERAWDLRNLKRRTNDSDPVLVFELDLSTEEYEWLTGLLGEALPGVLSYPKSLERLFAKVPLVFITTLVGNALLSSSPSFWDDYWARLKVRNGDVLYDLLRRELHSTLSRKQLAVFSSADLSGRNYVGTLELHAGIPARDLPAVPALIREAEEEGIRFRGAEEFGNWAVGRFTAPGSRQDYPVALGHLSAHLPARAVSIFARIHELHDYAREHGGWPADGEFEGTNGLPEPTFTHLVNLLSGEQEVPPGPPPIPGEGPEAALEDPYLHLDLDLLEFQLVFPEVAPDQWQDPEPPRWTVFLNEENSVVSPRPDWSHGGYEEHRLALSRPFAQIVVQRPDGTEVKIKGGFGPDRPVLFLRSSGRVRKNQKTLRGREVFAVMPAAAVITARTRKNRSFEYQDLGPVKGWQGWVARHLVTEDVKTVTVKYRSFRQEYPVPRDKEAVWDEDDTTIEHLKGTDLQPVHHSIPRITVPEDHSTWLLRYFQLTPSGERVSMGSYEVEDELRGRPFDVFDEEDDPWVGRYEVQVYRDSKLIERRTFNLAEGLELKLKFQSAENHGQFRVPHLSDRGPILSKAFAYFTSARDSQLRHPQEAQQLGEENRTREFTIASSADPALYCLQVQVDAPRLQYLLPQIEEVARWSDAVETVGFDDLPDTDELQLRFPQHVHDVELMVTTSKGERWFPVGEKISLSRKGNSRVWVCPMSRLKAEMPEAREYRIAATWKPLTIDEHLATRMTKRERQQYLKLAPDKRRDPRQPGGAALFNISKAPLLADARIEGERLELELGRAVSQPLIVWAWQVAAPLAPPVRIPMEGRTGFLPEELQAKGPLIIDVREEAFLMVWEPESPSARAIAVHQAGLQPEYDPLNPHRWLFAQDSHRDLLGNEIQVVWEARNKLHHVLSRPENQRIRSIANFDRTSRGYLLRDPRISLSELDKSPIPQKRQLEAFIRSGLVFENFSAWHTGGDIHPVPWIGLIQEMNDLRVLTGLRRDDESVAPERAESEHYIREVGGPELWRTFTGISRGAPLVQQYAFTDSDLRIVRESGAEPMRESLDLSAVGTAVISGDSRIAAQLAWVENRRDLAAVDNLDELFKVTSHWENLIDHLGDEELKRTARTLAHLPEVHRRNDRDNWLYVPYISFVASFLARMRAHDLIRPVHQVEELRHAWAICARYVPELTAFDLILAEASVLSTRPATGHL